MRRMMLVMLTCVALAGPAFAQKETPPAPGPPKDFVLPTPTRVTLPNGLKVTMLQYGAIPKAQVLLSVAAGNVEESANEVWLADFTTALMTEGTAKRTGAELSRAAAQMGGSISATAGPVRASVAGEVLSEFAADMVRLVAEVTQTPSFPAGEVERVRADLLRQLALQKSTPQGMATAKFAEVMYGDHPYGRYFPTEGALKGYTLEQVRRFHDGKFAAARSRLYVVGRFDSAAVERAAREVFGAWKPGAATEPPRARPTSARSVHIVDKPGAVQSTLIVGVPVVDPSSPDWIPLTVTNNLLGGYFSSRITSNIRESKGYTYSPFSAITPHPGDAVWAEQADVTTAVTGASLKEIFGEIDRLQAEAPPDAELDAVKNYQAGAFVFQNSQRGGILGQLQFLDLYGLPDEYLTSYIRRVRAVTPAIVQETAKKYIDDTRATVVVVGDRKVIESQVAEFGPVK